MSAPRSRRGSADPVHMPAWVGHIGSEDGHPDCWYCSWAWYGPLRRMLVKFVNAMCPKHARLVADLTSD